MILIWLAVVVAMFFCMVLSGVAKGMWPFDRMDWCMIAIVSVAFGTDAFFIGRLFA